MKRFFSSSKSIWTHFNIVRALQEYCSNLPICFDADFNSVIKENSLWVISSKIDYMMLIAGLAIEKIKNYVVCSGIENDNGICRVLELDKWYGD